VGKVIIGPPMLARLGPPFGMGETKRGVGDF